ncbi:polysaccharide deacetylase family protein [Natrinema caseinilyticum]|uniref:polysaccharide deacetylase family protein n=1 Tax=Natrinema caseinilyticum TaxID=2961570 RepID=UPI0020C24E13|nr:polysaccharide deacetylase family protein [Natrinema caseinilyticum]
MRDATPPVLREFETWLSLFTDGEFPDRHRWKAWFCVAEYELEDFERVSALLRENDATGSFAFLGRDAEEQADIIETLDDDGHEITFHSHRHHAYGDLSYESAHDAITTGVGAIEDATGITPNGFFVPFRRLSEGAVRAVEDAGFEWVLGRTEHDVESVELVEPVGPFDTRLLEDHSPEEATNRLREKADAGEAPFLFHPPVLEYHDGWSAFEEWIAAVEPVSVGDQLDRGGTGIVLDCVRPVRVE